MLFIGIDPSINSTGICIYDGKEYHYRLVVPNKLTKKMSQSQLDVQNSGVDFEYVIYEKTDYHKDDNHKAELEKTQNMIKCLDKCLKAIHCFDCAGEVHVVQEGISYGSSVRTKSIYDLAGLNYLLRLRLLECGFNLIICPPAEIKKFTTGMGNANKDMMTLTFVTTHPWGRLLGKCDDLADSFFMSNYAKHIFNSSNDL